MTNAFPRGIADFRDGEPAGNPWVNGRAPREEVTIVPVDQGWAARYAEISETIAAALGATALSVEHIGSTAVPGLAAKDIIDIDLTVPDAAREESYVAPLTALGYHLTVREPEFDEHRMLRLDSPRVNLHVYGPGVAETARHRLFRDWLRATPADRDLYAAAKRDAIEDGPPTVMEYNARKTAVVREIFARAFAAHGVPLRDRALALERLPELPLTVHGEQLTWRPARADDVERIHRITEAAGRRDHPQDLYSPDVIALGLTGERFTLATDTVLALTPSGEPVAYGEAKLSDTGETTTEVSLDGVVHLAWRGRGIGRALLAWQEARARQLLASVHSDLPAIMTVGSREVNAANVALYRAAGFLPVRWWMELWRSLADPIAQREPPEGVSIVRYTAELSDATRIAVNDAFRDHWGSQPTSPREWEEEHSLDDFAPHLSLLAVQGAATDDDPIRVVAAVLTEVDEGERALNGGAFAYIATVGVVRDWRGRGLASTLLRAALQAYREEGLSNAALDVDAANPSGARAMYTALGFELRDRSVTYAKYA